MTKFDILKWKHDFQKLKYKHNCLNSYTSVSSKMHTMSRFQEIKGDDFKLPILVTGRLVDAGTFKEKIIGDMVVEADELEKSTKLWEGIKIFKSHNSFLKTIQGEHAPIDDVIGRIIRTTWNKEDKGIDYVAEIMDRDIAFKIAKSLIESVSAGFGREIVWMNNLAFAKNIMPLELSLVFNPRDKRATIKVLGE